MRRPAILRPELAAVCRYAGSRQAPRPVRLLQPLHGILSELAGGRGRQ